MLYFAYKVIKIFQIFLQLSSQIKSSNCLELMLFIILFCLPFGFLPLNIYIDSNFVGNFSNGSLTNPFTNFDEISIIQMIVSNQISEQAVILMISNYCFIKTPISHENVSNLVFQYFLYLNAILLPIFERASSKNTENYVIFMKNGGLSLINSTILFVNLTIETDSRHREYDFCFYLQRKTNFQINVYFK